MNLVDPAELAWAVPALFLPLVLLVGLVLALVMRKRLGAVATTLILAGCVVGIVHFGFAFWWSYWGVRMVLSATYQSGGYQNHLMTIRVVSTLLSVSQVLWVSLLLAGAFVGRRRPQAAPVDPAALAPRPGESEWTVPPVV
ncbi:hypothetical protein Cs7R123_73800 [Catellatospora sp. TT07R-123]|uniref:hypothetical protein n=1 Tax=Catellatospora sp. TT07R-123 TaxID=2733863 RepID=UPI001AFFB6CA|nr:hypothetical protein [Catellatospora sp. TT07R-123]GHJ50038.1 hypothetical protein Cs7R123_73800 [Catellatospora sp. TT07R-123]